MRKIYFSICLLVSVYNVSFAQNAIVGTGFSTGWGGGGCPTGNGNFKYLSSTVGNTYIVSTNANGTGNQYFRMGVDFGGTTGQYAITPGSDITVAPNIAYNLNTVCTTSGAMLYNVPNASYNYIFKTKDAGTTPTGRFVFFELQGTASTVSSVTQSPIAALVTPSSTVAITATLNTALPTGQAVYLRYTNTSYAAATIVQLTGSGTTYTVNIPAATNTASAAVSYYVFTSGAGLTITNADADLFTINANNNSNSNYNYTVLSTPTLNAPTVTAITHNSATLGATITANGGIALSARGTVYNTTSPVTDADNALQEGGTADGSFSHLRTGLSPETQYFYAGYATNLVATSLSNEGNFRTISSPAITQASFLINTNGGNALNVSWTGAAFPATGATQAGYLLIYSTATPTLSSTNGNAPAAGVGTLVNVGSTNLPTTPSTSSTITGLTSGSTYNILLVPYTWDGVNTSTYNYLTSAAPTTTGTPLYETAIAGDWNTAATWVGGSVPAIGAATSILHAVLVNNTVTFNPNTINIGAGGSLTFGAAGNLTVNNTLTNGGSGVIMTAGGTLNLSNNATLANGTNTFTGGTGTVVFAGAGTVSGTIAFNNITANGGLDLAALTTTINGAFTLNAGAFVNPDAPSYGSSSTLIYNAGGTYNRNVEWGSLSAQGYPNNIIIQNGTTVSMNTNPLATNYGLAGNLKLGNATSAGNLDMNNAVRTLTIGGNVEIGDATGTSTLTLSSAFGGDLYIKGNWIRNANGVFNPTGRGVFFNGATAQTLTGATTFDYLLMSQAPASTLTLNNNINIAQTLTFGTGKIVTAGNIVIMNSTASATGASIASYINGVQQYDVASPVTRTFDVGDATAYAPVTSVFTAVSAGGALKVSTSAGDHVNILTSAIDETKTANRTWNLSSVAGLVGTHNTTFNFVAGDLEGTATPANFVVGNYNAAWTYPTVGTKTAVSTQANNINTFGDFQLGECRGVTVIITNPAIVCSPATVDITIPAVTVGSTVGLTYTYFTDAAATVPYATPTTATADTYYIKGTSASGCFDIKPITVDVATGSLWLGVSTNWNNTANWCNGSIPTGADNVTLPSGAAFYPIIPSGQVATTGFLDIAAGASMQVTGTGVLNLFGNITNAGILDLVDGTLRVSDDGSVFSPLISISGLSIKDKTIKNFIVATYVEISNALPNDTLKVTGLVSFLGNNNDLVTHDNLTLVSNAAGTASIGDITNGAFMNTGNTITGKVIIERYLPGIKAWRLLAAPVVTGATSPTITESWREGGTGLTSTGFGTRLTGPGSSNYGGVNNLDEYSIRASMKSYNMGSNNFTDVTEANLNAGDKIANDDGYYIFIRGDRGVDVYGTGTPTTLRIKGQVRTGNQTFGVDPSKFRSIGNPFPSRLDMRDVYLGGIKLQSFYVWNPAGVGNFNAGQYVGYTFTGTNFTNGAAELNYIESGQAFFVQNNDPGALNLVIKETDKTTGSANVSRGNATSPTLEINLKSTDANGTEILADGAMLNFDNTYSNGLDNYDVKKITNSFDNVAIKSNGTSLLVERKTALVVTDSIHLNMSGLRTANYKFEIDPSLLVHPELTAYLKDRFLQTETEVSLTSITNINFATTTDAASKAANRFVIVFRPSGVLPVTFVDIAAIKNANKTHTVKWAVANELNIQQYQVERSSNGSNFVSIGNTAASQQNDYNFEDAAPLVAINFYRVKAISQNGQVQYSAIVKLNADAKDASITLNTNPVNSGQVVLGFYNQQAGQYQVAIYNNLGQLVKSEKVLINGNAYLKTINMGNNFKGNGNIVIISLDGVKKVIPFVSY